MSWRKWVSCATPTAWTCTKATPLLADAFPTLEILTELALLFLNLHLGSNNLPSMNHLPQAWGRVRTFARL